MTNPNGITTLHALNLGAGVQSTTLELMFRKGLIHYDGHPVKLTAAGFADTMREPGYVYEHLSWLMSDAADHPIFIVSKSDIGEDLMRGENSTKQRFASIPAFTARVEGKKDGIVRRQCTSEYKIKVLDALWRRVVGAIPGRPIPKTRKLYLYFGISLDEKSRATRIWEGYHVGRPIKNKDGSLKLKKNGQPVAARKSPFEPRFPLIDMGMTRADCHEWLAKQGIPHEVKRSACVFCPFHSDAEWLDLQKNDPAGWEYAVELDRTMRLPGRIINRRLDQSLYLHSSCIPLSLVQLDTTPRAQKAIQTEMWQGECTGMCGM
jgi:hypothetical protein